MTDNLKLCPFCKEKLVYFGKDVRPNGEIQDIYKHPIDYDNVGIIRICPLSGLVFRERDWNERPLEEALEKRIAELENWIPVTQKLPKSNVPVQVSFMLESGKRVQQIGVYIAPKTIPSEDFLSDEYDCSGVEEYDEENDCYWVIEGWWESSYEAETNYMLSRKVTHWKPLPEFKEEGN